MVTAARIERHFKGTALSEGCAIARVCRSNEKRHSNLPIYRVSGEGVEREIERFHRARTVAAERIEQLRSRVEQQIGKAEAEIFVAQRMIMEDEALCTEIVGLIEKEQVNAETALSRTLDSYENRLLAMEDVYIKERATDCGEVKRRVLDELGHMQPALQCDEDNCHDGRQRIVVAVELTPGLTVDIDVEHTVGFVTERGGVNSHAAILARALGIPAVSGIHRIHERLSCGTEVLVDGTRGEVVVWPSEETITRAQAGIGSTMRGPEPVEAVPGLKVMANINMPTDIRAAHRMKAEGIGLYRTEFEVIAAERFFSEDELVERYLSVAESMAGLGVVFRLFDIGSDKTLPFMRIPFEENPALGWRGARLLLGKPELLRTQARALGRVSAGGRVHVLYPMIVDLEQFLDIRAQFLEAVADIPCGEIKHGVMFEVPSACLDARRILQEADFASIGTNDLTQYLFAVDRENEKVAADYDADRPVLWQLLESIARAGREAGKPISVCGELAGDPRYIERFVDLGLTTLSVSARRIPGVRKMFVELCKARETGE
jgi:phosphotransferase system enzyme I (PtsI)